MRRPIAIALCCACITACERTAQPPTAGATPPSDARVRALADAYLGGYFDRNPDQVTVHGVPGRHHDQLPDNSLDALKAWWAKEDGWLAEARRIDPATISAPPLRATYAIVGELLEGSIGARVCRNDLWNVSQMTGWQIQDGYLVTIQPVGSDLPTAREVTAVSANPNGAACYDAAVRYFSSLKMPASEIHALGLRQIDSLTAEMKAIAERSFQTSDVPGLLQKLRTDRRYLFKNRADLIAYSAHALARAKAAVPQWFGLLPKADVETKPYPAFREKNAPNEYNPPAEDGSRPGIYFISAYEAEKKSRAGTESTTFHETVPGHHLQTAIALERREIHPIGRYVYNSGYAEGWGLYAERLADEMNLFSSDLDRLGMLSEQALRASRLVVDSGLHVLDWTRQQAVDYMLAHTAESEGDVTSEVDRYIIYPGQATAYMLGMLEIRKARDEAQKAMGARFDIKAFHDRVLEDGAVPLTFLAGKIKAWAGAGAAK